MPKTLPMVLLLAFAGVLLAGCGVKGPPEPPSGAVYSAPAPPSGPKPHDPFVLDSLL